MNSKDYYAEFSCNKVIHKVENKVLFLQTEVDPISRIDFVPYDSILSKENFMLAVAPYGGHLEYFTGMNAERWNNKVAGDYI